MMRKATWYLAPALLLASASMLSSCGSSSTTDTTTTTPSSTLGTDSAASKVGGITESKDAIVPGAGATSDTTKKM